MCFHYKWPLHPQPGNRAWKIINICRRLGTKRAEIDGGKKRRKSRGIIPTGWGDFQSPSPPPPPPPPIFFLHTCTVIALHFNFIACVYSIEENCFYVVIPVYWEQGKWREERGGGAHMANKKLRQLKLNLYSPGSGLTQLKVRESNSTGWYVMSRQSPLGS